MESPNNKIISGKRKCAIASIRIIEGSGNITVNNVKLENYFNSASSIIDIYMPFKVTKTIKKYDVIAKIRGGGFKSQSDSLRLAISKALLNVNPENRKVLKSSGLLTRDSRIKERKKYGLKKARRAPQFSKR